MSSNSGSCRPGRPRMTARAHATIVAGDSMRWYDGIAQARHSDPHLLDELAMPRGPGRQLLQVRAQPREADERRFTRHGARFPHRGLGRETEPKAR